MLTEKTFEWSELTPGQQQTVTMVHAKACGTTTKKLTKIFEVAKPKIVIGDTYCRIHADSVDVVKLLVREYA